MKAKILDITGKGKANIDLPKCFSKSVREDIILKIVESKKNKQPYAPSPVAGNQSSASGNIVHKRHVWKSQYGRGMSRVPRKSLTKRGSQFNWVGAVVPNTRGGRRAHPPKAVSMINTKKINKKELKLGLINAINATLNSLFVRKKYKTLKDTEIKNLPLIIESKFLTLKTKEIVSSLKKILGKDLFKIALRKKSIRAGKGTMRGRKYKSNAGLLLVIGKDEKLKTTAFEVVNAQNLSVINLASGGVGRLTIYTENSIKYLGDKLK
jgi:large subunit ribosomal protein L4e